MKTIIFLITLCLIVWFICNRDFTPNENFDNNDKNKQSLIANNDIKSLLVNNNKTSVLPNNFDDKGESWIIKQDTFSDIANNYEVLPIKSDMFLLEPSNQLDTAIFNSSGLTKLENMNHNTNPLFNNNNIINNKVTNKLNKTVFLKTITDNNKIFNYMGVAFNEYYNLYYLIYEHVNTNKVPDNRTYENTSSKLYDDGVKINQNIINMKEDLFTLYEYILVKFNKEKNYEIVHRVSPRERILYNDAVYFSYGQFELGPLVVKKHNF